MSACPKGGVIDANACVRYSDLSLLASRCQPTAGRPSLLLVGTAATPIDPMLAPLQDNGGPTQTMALLPGSPAIGTGALTDSEWDQRGPGFARTVNGRTDIGA